MKEAECHTQTVPAHIHRHLLSPLLQEGESDVMTDKHCQSCVKIVCQTFSSVRYLHTFPGIGHNFFGST